MHRKFCDNPKCKNHIDTPAWHEHIMVEGSNGKRIEIKRNLYILYPTGKTVSLCDVCKCAHDLVSGYDVMPYRI